MRILENPFESLDEKVADTPALPTTYSELARIIGITVDGMANSGFIKDHDPEFTQHVKDQTIQWSTPHVFLNASPERLEELRGEITPKIAKALMVAPVAIARFHGMTNEELKVVSRQES